MSAVICCLFRKSLGPIFSCAMSSYNVGMDHLNGVLLSTEKYVVGECEVIFAVNIQVNGIIRYAEH